MQKQGGIPPIIKKKVRPLLRGAFSATELEDAMIVIPVLFECFSFYREDGSAVRGDGRGGLILSGEDIA